MPQDKIRWGIISTGRIAKSFATALKALPDAELVAVGSRTQEAADAFGAEFDVPHCYPTYEQVAADPDVDVVYIGTPHNLHCENTLMCLDAGKHVLCEKPFTINARETAAMIATARARRLFLMEAMWTRFIPAMVRVRQLIADGAIGDVWMLSADFSFRTNYDLTTRFFDPALGGGALLDVGIYCVSLSSALFGPPSRIQAMAHLAPTGVDERTAIQFGYPGGQMAILTCGIRLRGRMEVTLAGTEGFINIPTPWWKPDRFMISRPDQPDEIIHIPYESNAYQYQAIEVMRCLRAGETESRVMPLDETHAIMRTLDETRALWGMRYPADERYPE